MLINTSQTQGILLTVIVFTGPVLVISLLVRGEVGGSEDPEEEKVLRYDANADLVDVRRESSVTGVNPLHKDCFSGPAAEPGDSPGGESGAGGEFEPEHAPVSVEMVGVPADADIL